MKHAHAADEEAYRGRRVVITGGAGFIGSHLTEALVAAGAHAVVVDNLAHGNLANLEAVRDRIQFCNRDVSQPEAIADLVQEDGVVFHLAANASVPRSVKEPAYDFLTNAVGTLHVLAALRDRRVASCVVASSGAVYGEPGRFPIEEDAPLAPISPYGASKASAEALCRAFRSAYAAPVRIARIFNTYGPRQPRFVMYDFYRKLRRDATRLEILGDGKQIRDFCYVDDTVAALLALGRIAGGPCEAFNISSGASHSVVEVAREMIAILGLPDVRLAFTGTSWAGDARRWEVSIGKLHSATGYRPRYGLHEGLSRFVAWFDAHPDRIV